MDVSELSRTIATALASEYRQRAAELHKWADPLSEEQFWTNPFAFGNSTGHLVLHLTGNLTYYIGAQVSGNGYVRDRDLEFSDQRRLGKAEVLRKFDEAILLVIEVIKEQSEEDWSRAYTAEREEESKDRFSIFLRCVVHLYFHVGQISLIGRELLK
jgi:uncharacterized damage-inducible protein DinB